MTKLHELLAAEKTVASAWNTLLEETTKKLNNEHFFQGHTKSLKMIEDSPANEAIEAAAADHKEAPTNVLDTLHYALGIFANAENLQFQKNLTNTKALATVMYQGQPLFADLPVDQLLGLEARLAKIRVIMLAVPTLDAARRWTRDGNSPSWVSEPEHATKTEKIMVPVVLSPATDKHPAQVKESTKDNVVGKFTQVRRSGAATAIQKAEAIKLVDELLVEVKKARMRANETVVPPDLERIGDKLAALLLQPFFQE